MGMITQYLRLTPTELAELRRLLLEAPDDAFEFASELAERDLEDGESTPRAIDTDKAWAGLEYLLAKLGPPLNVISGGTPVTDEEWDTTHLGCSLRTRCRRRPSSSRTLHSAGSPKATNLLNSSRPTCIRTSGPKNGHCSTWPTSTPPWSASSTPPRPTGTAC